MNRSTSFCQPKLLLVTLLTLLLLWLAAVATPAVGRVPQQVPTPVDLSGWTAESYDAVPSFDEGVWTVADDNLSVFQSINGQPTIFYSDFTATNNALEGSITVETGSDDDIVGFLIGFEPGDSINPDADFLMIDWKQRTQSFNFGSPSDTPGSTSEEGLAVSRVIGIPTADEFWGHENFDHPSSDLTNGVMEIARARTLGDTGWEDNQTYLFRFEFTPTALRVFVDGQLEIDVRGSFADGRFAFYNFSQEDVRYQDYERTENITITHTYLPFLIQQ